MPKGKKKCGGCGRECGNRLARCECGFVFGSTKASPLQKVHLFTEGGKGRKQCSGCRAYTGVRTLICPSCNAPFNKINQSSSSSSSLKPAPMPARCSSSSSSSSLESVVPETTTLMPFRGIVIDTPAGICPAKLFSTEPTEVREWARAVLEAGAEESKRYSLRALKYWVRHYYDMYTAEWELACSILDSIFGGQEEVLST